jgi:hypothetical protein
MPSRRAQRRLFIDGQGLSAPTVMRIGHIFSRRGAYHRYKELLVRRDALERWYDFSNKSEEGALREWCAENGIDLQREGGLDEGIRPSPCSVVH